MPGETLYSAAPTSALTPQAAQLAGAAGQAGISGMAAGGASLGAGIGAGIAAMGPAAKAHRRMLKRDVAKLEAGKLGWSQAQKRQYLGEAMRASRAQLAPAEAELARERGAVGFGRSGAQTEDLGALQRAAQAGVAEAIRGGEALSQQQAIAKEADIKARVAAQRDKAAHDWGNVMGGVAGIAGSMTGIEMMPKIVSALGPAVGAM